jgi:hypothetical protein
MVGMQAVIIARWYSKDDQNDRSKPVPTNESQWSELVLV